MLAGVVQHQLVELAAAHLPGLAALVRLVVEEVERLAKLAVLVDELHAVLLDEVAPLHLVEHVEPLEHPIRFGDQRFADVEPREVLAFEELHLFPPLAISVAAVEPAGPPPMTMTGL